MQAPQFSEPAAVEHLFEGAHVGVHPAIVEHAQHDSLRLCGRVQFASGSCTRREWLVGDHVHSGRDGLEHQFPPGLWGRGDRDGVHSPQSIALRLG
jgi:hypothetical protein